MSNEKSKSLKLSIHAFAVVLIIMTYFESTGNIGITAATNPVRERQFGYSSTISGLLVMCFDAGFVALTLPFGYYGARIFTKPQWCSFGAFLIFLSFLLLCMPTFLSPDYSITFSEEYSTCGSQRNVSFCTSSASSKNTNSKTFVFLLFIGFALLGIGNIPQNTIAIQYIEENSSMGGFYFGVMQSVRSIGGISGAIIAAITLQVPINLKELPVSSTHLLWVGAYWIGFLYTSIAVAVFVPILLIFPKSFKTDEKTKASDSYDGFLLQAKSLLFNIPFLLLNLTSVTEAIVFAGFFNFSTKYFQDVLGFSTDVASYVLAIMILAAALGSIIGAGFTKIRNHFSYFLSMLIGLSFLQLVAGHFILFKCNSRAVAGINLDYSGAAINEVQLNSTCNSKCKCDEELFQPVCDTKANIAYYSGCYAGCVGSTANCTCVIGPLVQGTCSEPCFNMYISISMIFIFVVSMVGKIPLGIAASIKIINVDHISFAMAAINFGQRLSGMIPGPIIFGYLFDWSCILWQRSCDDTEGSCLLVDQTKLTWSVYSVIMTCCIFPIIFYFLAFLIRKKKNKDKKPSIIAVSPVIDNTDKNHVVSIF